MRKTRRKIDQVINEIGKRLSEGMLDMEIRDELGIKVSQYYAYKRKLYKRSADQFARQSQADLAFHKDLLHDRLTALYKIAQEKLPLAESKELAPMLMGMQNIAINLFKLESEGLRILASRNGFSNMQQQKNVQLIETNTNVSGQESDAKQNTIRILPHKGRGTEGIGQTTGQTTVKSTVPITDESEIY